MVRGGYFLLLLSAFSLISSCSRTPTSQTAVSNSQTHSPANVYLPLTQAQAAPPETATALPPPLNTATPEPFCTEPGEIISDSIPSQWAGSLNYRVYYPPCYRQNGRSYPTLYLLPGNIHTDSIWQDLGLLETADAQILAQLIPPMLIVMADGGWIAQNTSGGPGSYESVILHELIPHIEANTCAWPEPQARAIGGLSRGGYWALEIAFRHPTAFASVGGHSAALVDSYAGPDINPRYTGINHDLGELKIYLDIGQDDYLKAPLQGLHEDMAELHITHEWVLNEGIHEEAYWSRHLSHYLEWYGAAWPATNALAPTCSP